jgi:hypothetical protein
MKNCNQYLNSDNYSTLKISSGDECEWDLNNNKRLNYTTKTCKKINSNSEPKCDDALNFGCEWVKN